MELCRTPQDEGMSIEQDGMSHIGSLVYLIEGFYKVELISSRVRLCLSHSCFEIFRVELILYWVEFVFWVVPGTGLATSGLLLCGLGLG